MADEVQATYARILLVLHEDKLPSCYLPMDRHNYHQLLAV